MIYKPTGPSRRPRKVGLRRIPMGLQRDFFGGWSSPLWRQQGGCSMSKSCGGWRKRTSIVRVKYMSVHRKVAQALETRPVLKF